MNGVWGLRPGRAQHASDATGPEQNPGLSDLTLALSALLLPARLEFDALCTYTRVMSDEPDNLVLRYLRRLDEKMDRVIDEVGDLKRRVGVVEDRIANLERRFDRMETRLERIERRFDLIDQPTA